MRSILGISLLTCSLFAGVVQTDKGSLLEVYSQRNPQSDVVATVSPDKGQLSLKQCFNSRDYGEWCKVSYAVSGVNIIGYTDRKSYETIAATPTRNPTFLKTFGGNRDDIGNKIIAIAEGFLVVGYTQSFGEGQEDVYVVKLDKYGNKIFSSAYGGGNSDIANAVVEMGDSYMIAGNSRSFGNRGQSIYLAKISKDGDMRWQNGYYSDYDDYYSAEDMIKISDTNLLLAGSEEQVKFFNSQVDGYVNAIDTNGVKNGVKRYGGSKEDFFNSVISVNDGYVFGGTSRSWTHGIKDFYIVKTDKEGNRIWHNSFGFKYDEIAKKVIATQDGGYLMVGVTESDISNQEDIFVVKVNYDGTRAWQRHFGSKEGDEAKSVVAVNDGYVIAGYTKNTPTYNKDAYLLKIDLYGNIMWERKYGADRDDEANDIIKVDDGFVVTGYSTSGENHSKELYVFKVDLNGNL
jgi:hypothetical protein